MAIALEQTVTGLDAGTGSITLTSWTPGAYELVLLFVAQRNEALVPSIAGNGLTWVQVIDLDNTQAVNGVLVYRAMGSSPTTGSITVTDTSGFDVAVACRFSGTDLSGTHGSGAIEATGTAPGPAVDDNDMQVSVTTLTDNAWAVAAGTHRNSTFTVPGDQTAISINNLNGTAGNITTLSVWRKTVSPAGAVTMGGANSMSSSTDWCAAAVSIKPATAVAVTPNAAQAASSAVAPTLVFSSTSATPAASSASSAATVGAVAQGSLALSPSAASAAASAPNPGVMAGDDLTVAPAAASVVSSATHAATVQGSMTITPETPEAGVNALIGNIINLVLLTGLTAAAASAAAVGTVATSSTTVFLTLPRRRVALTLRSN